MKQQSEETPNCLSQLVQACFGITTSRLH